MNKHLYFSIIFIFSLIVFNSIYSYSVKLPSQLDIISFQLEKSIKTNNTQTIKSKIKDIFILPSLKVGGKNYPIDSVKYWDDVLLVAATLNSECRGCSEDEKEVLAQVIQNRVNHNYNGYGNSYYEQISRKAQFSGYKNRLNKSKTGKYFYFDGRYRIKINNNVYYTSKINSFIAQHREKENFSFNDLKIKKDSYSIENYKIAYKVIKQGYRTIPCNVFSFCNPKIATNKKEVARQRKNQIDLSAYGYDTSDWGHGIFSQDKNYVCETTRR